MSRLRGIVLAAAGCGLIAASLAWDYIRGADSIAFGREQQAGCLAGVALLAAGLWLGWMRRPGAPSLFSVDLRRWRRHRWLPALALALVATVLTLWLSPDKLSSVAAWLFWCYVAALCLLLPLRFGLQLFLAVALLNLILAVISTLKAELTGLPLMMLDLQIALTNPAGLWEALRFPPWTRFAALGGIALLSLYLLHQAWAAAREAMVGERERVARRAAAHAICAAVIGVMATVFIQRLFHDLRTYDETWDTVGVAAMAKEIGVLPYLAYSKRIEATRTGDYFRRSIGTDPPPSAEIRRAVERHMDLDSSPPPMPNIVIVLAESTFDPNAAFRLNREVRSSLFESGDGTVAVGPLHVNVVGGGTWVTEFETITGLDSRLFGYSGYYAHSSLSPYVTRSLFTYLEERGYRSSAFFPNTGEFYNYRNAYRSYGADRIFDSGDQGHPDDWIGTDTLVVDDFMRIMGPDPEGPFLSYVLLIENHGPHHCRVANLDDVPVRLSGTPALEPNCMLHEYLRRLGSTEAAVAALTQYLRGVEERQGRPFLLAIFGDHQPFSFSDGDWVGSDFAAARTAEPANQTFYHLVSSAPRRIRCCLGEIPATLLPTLISAYTAGDADDIYLGVNLWLYERCGPDALHSAPLTGLFEGQVESAADKAAAEPGGPAAGICSQAYASALNAFRNSGIFAAFAATTP